MSAEKYIVPNVEILYGRQGTLYAVDLDTLESTSRYMGKRIMNISDSGDRIILYYHSNETRYEVLDFRSDVVYTRTVDFSFTPPMAVFLSEDKILIRSGLGSDHYTISDLTKGKDFNILSVYARKVFLLDDDNILLVASRLYILTISSGALKDTGIDVRFEENFHRISDKTFSNLEDNEIVVYRLNKEMNISRYKTYDIFDGVIIDYIMHRNAIYFIGSINEKHKLYKYDNKVEPIVDLSIHSSILYLDYDANRDSVVIVTSTKIFVIDVKKKKIREADHPHIPDREAIKMIYRYQNYNNMCKQVVKDIRYITKNIRNTILKFLIH